MFKSDTKLVVHDQNIVDYTKTMGFATDQQVINYILCLEGEIYRTVKNRQTIKSAINKNNYFIKQHNSPPVLEIIKTLSSLKNPFCDASDEYKAIVAVSKLGIKTLTAACYGVKTTGLGQTSSFIVTNSIEPNIDLDKLCLMLTNCKYYYKFKRQLIEFIAMNTRKLHLAGLNHRDYYLCHYLLHIGGSAIKDLKNILNGSVNNSVISQFVTSNIIKNLYLIDLHRMQIRKKVPNRYIVKDLSALMFSVRDLKLTQTDYLRFLKVYFDIADSKKLRELLNKEKKFLSSIVNKANNMREKG